MNKAIDEVHADHSPTSRLKPLQPAVRDSILYQRASCVHRTSRCVMEIHIPIPAIPSHCGLYSPNSG